VAFDKVRLRGMICKLDGEIALQIAEPNGIIRF